jgi:uncharacterized protein YndB with AHSA1/START domain
MTRDAIEREIFIQSDIDYVWSLVSKAGFWVGDDLHFDIEAAEGDQVVIETEQYGAFPVLVERLDPPRYAAYRWASSVPGANPGAGNSTLVEFTLAERSGGVVVQLRESGFANLPDDARERALADNDGGWTAQLDRLTRVVQRTLAR